MLARSNRNCGFVRTKDGWDEHTTMHVWIGCNGVLEGGQLKGLLSVLGIHTYRAIPTPVA